MFGFKWQIRRGDCLAILPQLPDNFVNMILADLPYGITRYNWDSVIPLGKLWPELNRILKPRGAIVLTAGQPFTSQLVMSNLKNFKCEWIWVKNRGSNYATARYQPFKEHESICVFSGDGKGMAYYPIKEKRKGTGVDAIGRIYTERSANIHEADGCTLPSHSTKGTLSELRFPSSIQKFNTTSGREKRYHPTQKPVSLLEYFIRTYSVEKDLVLDFCMGSGSTGVACVNTNRRFYGIELESHYFQFAGTRLGR